MEGPNYTLKKLKGTEELGETVLLLVDVQSKDTIKPNNRKRKVVVVFFFLT